MCVIRFFPWYGGKLRLVGKLLFLIPEHDAWYEPYGGSAAMTLNQYPEFNGAKQQIINELDEDIYNLWKVIKTPSTGKEFIKQLGQIEYGKEIFAEAYKKKTKGYFGMSDLEKALCEYILITQSFNAARKTFAKRDGKNYKANNVVHVRRVYERIKKVEVLNSTAIDLIQKVKENKKAFLFLDPPYLHEYRGKCALDVYGCEMTSTDHEELLMEIRDATCQVLICGYRSGTVEETVYDRILKESRRQWHCYLVGEVPKPTNKRNKEYGKEYVWVNYDIPTLAKFIINVQECGNLTHGK